MFFEAINGIALESNLKSDEQITPDAIMDVSVA